MLLKQVTRCLLRFLKKICVHFIKRIHLIIINFIFYFTMKLSIKNCYITLFNIFYEN
jgi:hypothetical protein